MTLTDKTYELMKEFAPVAGELLLMQRGSVVNIGKDDPNIIHSGEDPSGAYLTVMDLLIQDAFLKRLHDVNPQARVNVEEDTELVRSFSPKEGEPCTVHQDPIDGTKSYTKGESELFSTGYAISNQDNDFTHTVVYAPARGRIMYTASPDGFEIYRCRVEGVPDISDAIEELGRTSSHVKRTALAKRIALQELTGGEGDSVDMRAIYKNLGEIQALEELEREISDKRGLYNNLVGEIASIEADVTADTIGVADLGTQSRKVIYEKRSLAEDRKSVLEDMGYEISSMGCAHLRVIDVALGEQSAFLYGGSNPHDSMIPFTFAAKLEAQLVDMTGNPITGKDMVVTTSHGITKFERLPFVGYFSGNNEH